MLIGCIRDTSKAKFLFLENLCQRLKELAGGHFTQWTIRQVDDYTHIE